MVYFISDLTFSVNLDAENIPKLGDLPVNKYKLDTETKGSTVFRKPRALGCSDPSAARALLRARGFLIP